MDLELFEKIKKLAIITIFSDDELMDKLVLKGGNAIQLIYKISGRASNDLDFSMEDDFKEDEIESIREKAKNKLETTFGESGFRIIDYKFTKRPGQKKVEDEKWGGYRIEFKVIDENTYQQYKDNLNDLRKHAVVLNNNHSPVLKIDISKFEYCRPKVQNEIDGYTIYVYTPEMLILEKVRAICQHSPEYEKLKNIKNDSNRSRDFYDIFILIEKYEIDINSKKNKDLLKIIFEAKDVPISFLKNIRNNKEMHKLGYDSLKDTVSATESIRPFDFYFDYLIDKFENLFD